MATAARTTAPGYVSYPARRDGAGLQNDSNTIQSSTVSYPVTNTAAVLGSAAAVRGQPASAIVAAPVPAAGPSAGPFKVVAHALNDAFDALHPRGGDGRFIDKGGQVKWRTDSGLWMRGTVDKIGSDGSIDVTGTDGVKRVVPAAKIFAAPRAVATLSPAGFHQVAGQGGSTAGGFFRDPATAETWYVKKPDTADHVSNEFAANKMYSLAGAAVPEVRKSPDGKQLLSRVEHSEGWYQLDDAEKAKARESIRKNFLVDAWLGNYDAPRNDNIRVDERGVPIRVDTGGALKYKARGTPKTLPHDMTAEVAKLRQQSAYRGMTRADEEDAAKRILAVSPDDVKQAISDSGLSSGVADDLIARRAWIGATYGYQLPETTPAGRAALAARAAVANGTAVAPAPGAAPGTFAAAVRKRDSHDIVAVAPGSPVWLKKKPAPPAGSAKYPDTWTVDTVSADGGTVAIKTAAGQKLTVARSSVEPLRANFAAASSQYGSGEKPSVGDRVALEPADASTPPRHGTVTELSPLYARVTVDNGRSKVVHLKKLTMLPDSGTPTAAAPGAVPAASAVAPAPRKTGLYSQPYDGNSVQNDWIKQAETLVRSGHATTRTFSTTDLLPTQDEKQTQSYGSGRGAKDLGLPVVARIGGADYLMDGHHRAYSAATVKAHFVDMDAAGLTKNGAPANPSANPKGVPFDLAGHDFAANPHPVGYSLTHNVAATYVSRAVNRDGTDNDRDIIAVIPNRANPKDPLPVRIRADNFRQLDSVDHDALASAPPAAARAKKASAASQPVTSLADAKARLKPVPFKVKYPSANAAAWQTLEPGDQLVDVKDPYATLPGLWLLRGGEAHYLGSNRAGDSRQYAARRADAAANDPTGFSRAVNSGSASQIANMTEKIGKSPDWIAAVKFAATHGPNGDSPVDFLKGLSATMPVVDPAGKHSHYSVDTKDVPWPVSLGISHNLQTVIIRTDPVKDAQGVVLSDKSPAFVFDGDTGIVWHIGELDNEKSGRGRDQGVLPPEKWTALTAAQRGYYFQTSSRKTFGVGDGSDVVRLGDIEPVVSQRNAAALPTAAQALVVNGKTVERPTRPTRTYGYGSEVSLVQDVADRDKIPLFATRENTGLQATLDANTVAAAKLKPASASPADAVKAATSHLTPEPAPGAVLPGHRAPFVPTKVNPVQALGYKLPTSRASLDSGAQDDALLTARLVIPEEAEQQRRPGSRARPSFVMHSDATAHKDPLLYEYTKNVGGDAAVIRLPKGDFDAWVKKNDATVWHRGVGSAESDTDFKTGTYFAGEGVYGSGSYASNRRETAVSYANDKASLVTRMATKPGATVSGYSDLYSGMLESVSHASDERLKQMQALGLAPSDAQLANANPPLSKQASNFLDQEFSSWPASGSNPGATALQSLKTQTSAIVSFYENAGLRLKSVYSNRSYYGGASADVKLQFTHPNDSAVYQVTITKPSADGIRVRGPNAATNLPAVYDFAAASTTLIGQRADTSVSHTATSGEAFRSGFSSPKRFHDFVETVAGKKLGIGKTLFASSTKSAAAKTEDNAAKLVAAAAAKQPEITKLLGLTARLEFIQDVGRYGLASGVDRFDVPIGGRETYAVFTNRNALVMSR